jgi:choline dehydrogenase-like flavoprotein
MKTETTTYDVAIIGSGIGGSTWPRCWPGRASE